MLKVKRFGFAILVFMVSLIIMNLSSGSILVAEEQAKLSYSISIDPNEHGHVEANLKGLSKSSVDFRMSTVDQTDLKNNISNFTATGADGESLSVSSNSSGWTVNPGDNDIITVSYDFGLKFIQSSGRSWNFVNIDENYGFFYNEAVYAFPDLELDKVYVEFDLPDEWSVGTHFLALGNNRFQVDGVPEFEQEILYNTTRLGKINFEVTREFDDFTMSFFVFQPPQPNYGLHEFWRVHYETTPKREMKIYLDKTYEAIQVLKDIFGYWPGSSRYVVTTISEGDDLHSLTGFDYWMQSWTRERRHGLYHHVAHVWIWRDHLNLDQVDNWLEEGIPMYYQAELPYRIENNDMWLGLNYLHYLIIKRAEQHQLMDKRSIFYYAQNHLRTLALDREIKAASDGDSNMDSLMHYIGQEYGNNSSPITHSQMAEAVSEVAGADLGDFYNRYMTERIFWEIPPVEHFIDDYKGPFLEWLDTYAATPGYDSGDSKTMLLIALEIGIHEMEGEDTEHSFAERANPHMLKQFREVISDFETPFNENDIIEALSNITGVDQSDFFDFYTIGEYHPSVEEVNNWYENPPHSEPFPAVEDRSIAYVEPNKIPLNTPTEIKIVIKDEDLVSHRGHVRVGARLTSDENLGVVLSELEHHDALDNLDVNGHILNLETGVLQCEQHNDRWEGAFIITLPNNFAQMQIQADEETDYNHTLAIWPVEPESEAEEETLPEEEADTEMEQEEENDDDEKESIAILFYITVAIIIAGIGIYLAWKRKKQSDF